MKKNSSETVLGYILGFVIIGFLIRFVINVLESSSTKIISEKGLNALSDAEKKNEIDNAFEHSIQELNKTGIWKNPELEL